VVRSLRAREGRGWGWGARGRGALGDTERGVLGQEGRGNEGEGEGARKGLHPLIPCRADNMGHNTLAEFGRSQHVSRGGEVHLSNLGTYPLV
jgi:hypothetical protein